MTRTWAALLADQREQRAALTACPVNGHAERRARAAALRALVETHKAERAAWVRAKGDQTARDEAALAAAAPPRLGPGPGLKATDAERLRAEARAALAEVLARGRRSHMDGPYTFMAEEAEYRVKDDAAALVHFIKRLGGHRPGGVSS